jgi:hypothetical protein
MLSQLGVAMAWPPTWSRTRAQGIDTTAAEQEEAWG